MNSEQQPKQNTIFYELCYDQYKFGLTETDQLYQRIGFVLILLSLIGSIIYKLGRLEIFNLLFVRIDVFLYYFSILAAIILLALSITFAILYALPRRRKYKNLADMNQWQEWREKYNEYLKNKGNPKGETVDEVMLQVITPKLAEAQAINAPINEKRRQYFHLCVLMGSLAIIPVCSETLFYLLLRLQGILNIQGI